jgi:pimeloyl-ACP methyl ester carboxylesterase
VDELTIQVGGAPTFYRRAPVAGDEVLYLHSVPTSSDDWVDLLGLAGGVAPDLPGFGRSGKAGHLDYSLPGYVRFVENFLDELGLDSVTLVGHGWGAAIGLMFAQRSPERIDRLAIIDAIPLLPGFQWPGIARWWRRPVIGELVMGSVARWMLARMLRNGATTPEAWPDARIDRVWEQFDQGTQRAILRLFRSVDAGLLAAAGADLGELEQPALIVWGGRDPWIPPLFAESYAHRLPGATVERIPDAGHWPWLDQPEVTVRLAEFVGDAQHA